MKTVTLNNIMATEGRGYFAATLSNCTWQSSSITPGDGSTQSARVIPSASGEVTLTSAKHNLIASHKYYVTFKIKFESEASGTVDWYWPVAEPPAINHMTVNGDANTWIKCSAIFDRAQFSNGSYPCRFDYNNESTNVAFRFTSCMLFDLTEAFGEGKEPSKEWLDVHITSFAETQTVHYYETLKELFSNIANAIRSKTKKSDKIFACDFPDSINAIETEATFNFDGTATAADILEGKTAYTNDPEKVTGTIKDGRFPAGKYRFTIPQITCGLDTTTNDLTMRLFYQDSSQQWLIDQTSFLTLPIDAIRSAYKITADKIVKGNTIAGVNGTAQILKGYIEDNDNNNATISLDPTKSYIIVIGSLWAASEPGLRILWLKPFTAQTTHSPTVLIDNLTSKITYEYDSTTGKTLKSTGDDSYYYVFPFVESTTD